MARYRQDPHWITARYPGKCNGCARPISKDERAFYYPTGKRMYGGQFDRAANPICTVGCDCGEQQSAEFNAAVADEAFYNA